MHSLKVFNNYKILCVKISLRLYETYLTLDHLIVTFFQKSWKPLLDLIYKIIKGCEGVYNFTISWYILCNAIQSVSKKS